MLLTRPATVQPLQQQQQQHFYPNSQPHPQSQSQQPQQFYLHSLDFDLDASFDDAAHDLNSSSISSSPLSTQSLLSSHYSLANQPASFSNYNASHLAVPRRAATTTTAFDDSSLNLNHQQDLMQSDAWVVGSQYIPKPTGRLPHQRESSLSSMGSAGPASPFNHNTTNPQIAVTDSIPDNLYDMQSHDNNAFYQLASKSMAVPHDNMYPNYNGLNNISSDMNGYTSALNVQRPRSDRSLLPAPELSVAGNRSHPNSVASSIAGDSPATPSHMEQEDDRRRKAGKESSSGFDDLISTCLPLFDDTVFSNVPKLDRTMTDIYNDELYSPNFTITSASPAQPQMAVSPSNDVFAQRLSAANNQHLSAAHSPASSVSRDRSPFRQGSPLAPVANHDFGTGMQASRLRFNSAHQMREQKKAEQDAQIMRQQMSMKSEPETPKTISPKDAMLEFHDADGDSSFPLFPSQESADFEDIAKAVVSQDQQANFARSAMQTGSAFPYMSTQLQTGVHIPQQYPFIAHPRQSQTQEHMPRLSSAESSSGISEGTPVSNGVPMSKPAGTAADGGTYTCTYHGCTMRFETPALLQKHKREGHRQTQGIGGPRRPDTAVASPNSLLNSQAGPHRCDRINPSTGKPCHTIFSRPYDLTRHEDTIHNARKQKVRCNLCTEEKTFSRADALTRHYRVCHPDVEFPGKHRRRGQNA
ncbi:transcriptional regulator sdnM [Colletotrichum spaethianum]|uniref:Transcriptional regulator sdnM n=1 Tax=Colletotrichum spaethianum TaxID=700344 RepID=A0AA37PC17_9PEZI|nr:transcriptional regulator sdnM [Colletotrichum spaethianum]GKT49447.1 transcriptional regulator sdnM [Colletotrichum spaethianum]